MWFLVLRNETDPMYRKVLKKDRFFLNLDLWRSCLDLGHYVGIITTNVVKFGAKWEKVAYCGIRCGGLVSHPPLSMLMDSMYPDLQSLPNTGTVTVTIDAKGRLSLPTALREWVSKYADGKLTLNPDNGDKILECWATSAFHHDCAREMENVANNKSARRTLARTFKNACDLKMDASGRIRISPGMRSELGLTGKVLLYVAFDHFEICHPDNDPDATDSQR